jgi:hypothetical protein
LIAASTAASRPRVLWSSSVATAKVSTGDTTVRRLRWRPTSRVLRSAFALRRFGFPLEGRLGNTLSGKTLSRQALVRESVYRG